MGSINKSSFQSTGSCCVHGGGLRHTHATMPIMPKHPPGDPSEDPIRIAVSGNLDLHTFRPRDLPDLLPAWFEECRARGIFTVRVIHGKGTGTLRSGVHAILPCLTECVASWTYPAPDSAGGWGATLVQLKPA